MNPCKAEVPIIKRATALTDATSDLPRLDYSSVSRERLTHYLFRYPAKFHPPVARTLIERYSTPGMRLLDPFCGSGTVLVEAVITGRSAVGTDIDPLAVFASSVKVHRYHTEHLQRSCNDVLDKLDSYDRGRERYTQLMFEDIDEADVASVREAGLWVPPIPNLYHWFRKYVIIDLARILDEIQRAHIPETHRNFLRLCFASVIRRASNADPVPVSGLEVTSHMLRKDEKGRLVDPFALFRRAVSRGLKDVKEYAARAGKGTVNVRQVDATSLSKRLRGRFDLVITSPPYNSAVDYYRRHQLETFWLGFAASQEERQELKHRYIGRTRVRRGDVQALNGVELDAIASRWEKTMRDVDTKRADAFKHYLTSMRQSFTEIATLLRPHARAICVVGHSRWQGREIPTRELLAEAAEGAFDVEETLWYPIKNRYMSYARHNGASIDEEFVLVLRRT